MSAPALGTTLRRAVHAAVRAAALACVALLLSAHIGTNDAFYDGMAGAYPVRVTVRMPGVIPGQAQIDVRVLQGSARRVLVQVALWQVGRKGAPAPDEAKPVAGAPGTFSAPLWLMTSGSYTVNVTVEGAQGTGTATVPVNAVATARLGMNPALGWGLVVLGAALFAGLLTLVGAALRESVVAPGEVPDAGRRRMGRAGIGVTAAIAALALVGGNTWWKSVDRGYERGMYRPAKGAARVIQGAGGDSLRFTLVDSLFFNGRTTPLIPDHGRLMHLFVVRSPSHDALAHLHPTRVDSATFDMALPELPAGHYKLFGDVVHESGFTRTVVAEADLPGAAPTSEAAARRALASVSAGGASDGDDAWINTGASNGGPVAAGLPVPLGSGYVLRMEPGPAPVAGKDAGLRFTVRDGSGQIATLHPYLGMAAHAVVLRDDESVFVHLHPMGTVSMAAQARLLRREAGDTVMHGADQPAESNVHDAMTYAGTVSFPFAFPKPGHYLVWVQVRPNDAVRTAVFEVLVR